MSEWKARRFWKAADIAPQDGGWQVLLDGKPLRTPGKQALICRPRIWPARLPRNGTCRPISSIRTPCR